jgi:hypothetical protein
VAVPDRSLQDVRRKFVRLMKVDPPPARAIVSERTQDSRLLDTWLAARFSPEEIAAVLRLEVEYGERALAEWFAEIAFEAGLMGRTAH